MWKWEWINEIFSLVDDDQGKEVIFRYDSETIFSSGEFWTDSNGRQMIQRLRDQRMSFEFTQEDVDEEPTASNYYPVTTGKVNPKLKSICRSQSCWGGKYLCTARPPGVIFQWPQNMLLWADVPVFFRLLFFPYTIHALYLRYNTCAVCLLYIKYILCACR